MFFDARAAKLLKPGEHLVVDGCDGLHLVATASKQTWTYRYKSPATGLMKQTAIGQYPSMKAAAWDALRKLRAEGIDPRDHQRQKRKPVPAPAATDVFTVRELVGDYITGHLERERKEDGAKGARRGAGLRRFTCSRSHPCDVLRSARGPKSYTDRRSKATLDARSRLGSSAGLCPP